MQKTKNVFFFPVGFSKCFITLGHSESDGVTGHPNGCPLRPGEIKVRERSWGKSGHGPTYGSKCGH